ncbi:MAG TPA: hypothetical protein VFA95_15600 [Gammaproteobacteria bacterium]|nr:hypothetical protein [Gammaproteobacteria bacterium]
MNDNTEKLLAVARNAGIPATVTVERGQKVRQRITRLQGLLPPGYRLELHDRLGLGPGSARQEHAPAISDLLIEGFPSELPLRLHLVPEDPAGRSRSPA